MSSTSKETKKIMNRKTEGKIALITGASRGTGAVHVDRLGKTATRPIRDPWIQRKSLNGMPSERFWDVNSSSGMFFAPRTGGWRSTQMNANLIG